jgi:hypothetical protein
MNAWAVDLGTTNTAVATWDEAAGQPRLVELPAICRQPAGSDPRGAFRPSAVEMLATSDCRPPGAWPPLARTSSSGAPRGSASPPSRPAAT